MPDDGDPSRPELDAAPVSALAERIEQLESALRTRPVIEQAKGMIMMVHRCDADTAFRLLTGVSQSCNRKLREVASVIVGALSSDEPLPADVSAALDARLRRGALDSGA
jgi:hypothetical protein